MSKIPVGYSQAVSISCVTITHYIRQRLHSVLKYGPRCALMWMHHFFSSTHARIRARCRCPSTRSRPCSWAQKWVLGPCLHTIFVSSGQSTALLLLLSSCFNMESDGAKWSNYVHSHISGTLSGSTAPFCAGTQALVPKHLVRTAPKM